MRNRSLDTAVLILLIIGGLNWGLVGIFNFNLVTAIFGDGTAITRIIYIVIGLAALVALFYNLPRSWSKEME